MEARPMGEHSAFDRFRAQGGTLIWYHIFVCISVLNRTMKCTILMPPWVWNGRNYVDIVRSTMKCTILMPPWAWNGRNYVDFARSTMKCTILMPPWAWNGRNYLDFARSTMKCTSLIPPWAWNGRNCVDFVRSLRYQCSPIRRDGRGDPTTYPKNWPPQGSYVVKLACLPTAPPFSYPMPADLCPGLPQSACLCAPH